MAGRPALTLDSESDRPDLTTEDPQCAGLAARRAEARATMSGPRDGAGDSEAGGVMARQSIGHVIERPWSDGETVSYGAQVRAYGRYEKVTFGTNKQGWSRTRAELETERIIQQIERGTWVPPRLEPRENRLEEAMAALGVQVDEMFWDLQQALVALQAARPRREDVRGLQLAARIPAAVLRPLSAERDHATHGRPVPRRARRAVPRRSASRRGAGGRSWRRVIDKRGRTYERRRRRSRTPRSTC